MFESFTPGALRALDRAQGRARRRSSEVVEPADLLAALVDEPESRAAALLAEHGLIPEDLLDALGVVAEPPGELEIAGGAVPGSPAYRDVLDDALVQARSVDRNREVGTEHLLAGLLGAPGMVAEVLGRAGLQLSALLDQLGQAMTAESGPIPMAAEIPPLELTGPADAIDLGRVLDASANRAAEGLRVVEDYIRFVLDDPALTRRAKDVRHRLGQAIRGLDPELLIGSRDTIGDVGTHIMTAAERVRENPRAVLTANFKRAAEALRSLEEYTKLTDVWLSGRFEVLRYDVYTLEKLTLNAVAAHRTLDDVRLYVLVGGQPTLNTLIWIVEEALAGGAQAIQLREKGLPDRLVLEHAREVRIVTAKARAAFFLNDRPDLARLTGADGVHLGQGDMGVRDARRIVGASPLIGVSTHDRDQLERAILGGAGYLGVGPVFPSRTKDFHDLAGLGFVGQAAETTTLPWFAIGGIDESNLDQVIAAGARRIAVSSAVVEAERPRAAASALRARLDEVD
jgi:thiamine-phosphate pyrophosphorylase